LAFPSFSLRLQPDLGETADGLGAGQTSFFLSGYPVINSSALIWQNSQMYGFSASRQFSALTDSLGAKRQHDGPAWAGCGANAVVECSDQPLHIGHSTNDSIPQGNLNASSP
jgi:hypothetical protein